MSPSIYTLLTFLEPLLNFFKADGAGFFASFKKFTNLFIYYNLRFNLKFNFSNQDIHPLQ